MGIVSSNGIVRVRTYIRSIGYFEKTQKYLFRQNPVNARVSEGCGIIHTKAKTLERSKVWVFFCLTAAWRA
jgi:hypothetical protein